MGCARVGVGGRRGLRWCFDHGGSVFFDAALMRPASGVLLRFGGNCTVRFVGIFFGMGVWARMRWYVANVRGKSVIAL